MPRMPSGAAGTATDPAVAALWEAVGAAKDGRPLAPVTVVVPTTTAAVATRRELPRAARRAGWGGVANVECTTVDLLAQALAAPGLAAGGTRTAPPALDAEVARQCLSEEGRPWSGLGTHPRTLAAVQRAFTELRGLPLAALEPLARRQVAGAGVVALLLEVRRRLHDRGFADRLDLRAEALAAAARQDGHAATGALVVVEPLELAPGDAAVLEALTAERSCRRLTPPPAATATEHWECADPEEEVRAAVRAVVAGAEEGVPLWRQAILHPPGPGYVRLVRQQLALAGVASNGPELRRLDGSAAGRALIGLLELAGGDWPRHRLLAWLSGAPVRTGPGGRPVPVSRWNALSAAAGVVRGVGQWRQRLERLAGDAPAEADEARALAAFVEDLAQHAGHVPARWPAAVDWALGLLEDHLDPDAADGPPWPAEQRLAHAQVREALASLADLDAVSAHVEPAEFRRAVRAELERRHLDTGELEGGGVGDGVFVASYERAAGLCFHTAVLVGLADAFVPGRAAEDALLSEELRALDTSGGLPTRAARQDHLERRARAALATGTERRIVLHPGADPRTGRAHVPSRLLEELLPPSLPTGHVPSLLASLTAGGPALSATERVLRELRAWEAAGLAVAHAPPVRLDDRLARGLDAVQARSGPSFTRFDGLVGAGRVTPFDPARPLSATRLETYAECPRRFLFDRVLGIHARVLPEDLWRIEARDRGSLVHAVLEHYVAERIAGAPRSLDRLLAIAEDHLDRAAAGGLVGKALLWRLDRAAITRDLHVFFAEEGGLEPVAAELSFGDADDEVPAVRVALADGRSVQFRGRADRVDRSPDGELVVSDYKTGRQTGIARLGDDPLDGGRRLQLPLYAMAARQAFAHGGPVRARYWMVSAERSAALYELELTEPVERHFGEVVGRITAGIEAGCFPAIPGPPREHGFEGCAWCDFDRVCPATRDRQWAAKRAGAELAPVVELVDAEAPEALPGTLVRAMPAAAPRRKATS